MEGRVKLISEVEVFWIVMLYSDVGYQCFGGLCCLHLQGKTVASCITSLHNITTQKTMNLNLLQHFGSAVAFIGCKVSD